MNKYYAGTRNSKFAALGLLACALLLTFLAGRGRHAGR